MNITKINAALIVVAALHGCGGSSGGDGGGGNTDAPAAPPALPPAPEIPAAAPLARQAFIVIGDSGTGSAGQYAVGEAIARVCELKAQTHSACRFVVGLGDNIYEDGVDSVDDMQFDEKFELPFAPVELPFYMVLGNHDNTGFVGGDGTNNARGEFQVQYTYYDGRRTDRWQMPDRYYQFSSPASTANGAPLIDFFALDSNPIAGGFADPDLAYAFHTYGIDQRNWAVTSLASSPATFRIALAHHPYLSNGSHGNAGNYDGVPGEALPVIAGQRWKTFLEEAVCDKADFFFAGHDHDLQVLNAVPQCGRTEFVVSGAAGKMRPLGDPERNDARYQVGDQYGFFWMEATEADAATGAPATLCIDAYEVLPGSEGLGVELAGAAAPAYSYCYTQQPLAGLAPSSEFSGVPISAEALPLPLPDDFDDSFQGALGSLRTTLVSGLQQGSATLPAEQRQVVDQIIAASDVLFAALDSTATTVLQGAAEGPSSGAEMAHTLSAVLTAAQQLAAIDTDTLPAPFDQLGDAFDALAAGVGNQGGEGAEGDADVGADVAFIAGPLVSFARNLHNIVDGVEEQVPEGTPVLSGLSAVLATTSLGLANTLEQLVLLESSAGGEQLIGTLRFALEQLVVDTLWLDQVPGLGGSATLPGDGISTLTLLAVREVTEQLDQRLLDGLPEWLSPLAPLTQALRGLLAGL